MHLRHAGSEEERTRARRELAELDSQLAALRETMRAIEKQCELDAIQEQRALLNRS